MRVVPALRAAVGVLAVAVVFAACGEDSPSSSPSSSSTVPASVPAGQTRLLSCMAYYRPLGDASTEGAIEQTVELEAQPGSMLSERSADFDTMSFTVAYSGSEFEGESVLVYVFDEEQNVLTQALYQAGLDELAGIDFVGGHGFTGLHYVNHEGAQLQFWCSAE